MLKNYIITALRNIRKNNVFSLINIFGLVLGLACSLLILLWVHNETTIDSFHTNNDRLYTVYERKYFDHTFHGMYYTPALLGRELKQVIPEVEYASNVSYNQPYTFRTSQKTIKLEGTYADEDFFKMFSYHLLTGNIQTALTNPSSIAISHKMANIFFGNPDAAMDKTLYCFD